MHIYAINFVQARGVQSDCVDVADIVPGQRNAKIGDVRYARQLLMEDYSRLLQAIQAVTAICDRVSIKVEIGNCSEMINCQEQCKHILNTARKTSFAIFRMVINL